MNKKKRKKRNNFFIRILLIISFIFLSSLVIAAVYLHFSFGDNFRYYQNNQVVNMENEIQIDNNDSLSENKETNIIHPPQTNNVAPSTPQVIISSPSNVDGYRAIVSVVQEGGLKVVNHDIFDFYNNRLRGEAMIWAPVILEDSKDIFKVQCKTGFAIKDCTGGTVVRNKKEEYCWREVEIDTKNTLILKCGSY